MQITNIDHYCYANDMIIDVAPSTNDYLPIDLLCMCIEQVKDWMCQNVLKWGQNWDILFGAQM